jgi:hypothetical protein
MARKRDGRLLSPEVLAARWGANRDLWTGESLSLEQLKDKHQGEHGRLPEEPDTMLMIRRRQGTWIDIVHSKSGDTISLQIQNVVRIHGTFQVTMAVDDRPRNFEVIKPDAPRPAADEPGPPPTPPP